MTNKTESQTNTSSAEVGAVELNDAQLDNASGGYKVTFEDILVSSVSIKPADVKQMGDGSVKPAGR